MSKLRPVRLTKIASHPNRSFTLAAYDPNWPKQFAAKAKILQDIFGSEALAIEHVGSTAIPGMVAKPQIDVVIIVKDLSKVSIKYKAMTKAGYTARGDYTGEGEEYFTEDDASGNRQTSVHVLPRGHVWTTDLLNFRDYLRAHPKESARYAEVKRQAKADHPEDYDAYYKAKLAVIQPMRQRAANWRQVNTG